MVDGGAACGETAAVAGVGCGDVSCDAALPTDRFRLSAAQLIGLRRLLKKLAVPPRRWKKPQMPTVRARRRAAWARMRARSSSTG
jgi:hypothetical protein